MKNKLLIISLLSMLALTSCGGSSPSSSSEESSVSSESQESSSSGLGFNTIPPYTPPTPPAENKNISSIDVLGIPEDRRIAIGLFDEANISYRINYTDSTSDTIPLLHDDLPYELQEMLGVPGEHYVTIQIRNVATNFSLIMVDEGIRYLVRFLNYNEDEIYRTKVMPDNKVSYHGDTPRRMSDIVYKYEFQNWDFDIDHDLIVGNTDIHAVYKATTKLNDYLPLELGSQYIKSYPDTPTDVNYAMYYAGRITNVPIAVDIGDRYKYHTTGNRERFAYDMDQAQDSPVDSDPGSDLQYAFHPEIKGTLTSAVRNSYNHESASGIDPKYLPSGYEFINLPIVVDPITPDSIRSRNIEGKTYSTATNEYATYINSYLSVAKVGDVTIPSEYPSGYYGATLYIDIDIYIYVYATKMPSGTIQNSPIFFIPCPSNIYFGLTNVTEAKKEAPFDELMAKTSTYDEDMITIELIAEMMKKAREPFEE